MAVLEAQTALAVPGNNIAANNESRRRVPGFGARVRMQAPRILKEVALALDERFAEFTAKADGVLTRGDGKL